MHISVILNIVLYQTKLPTLSSILIKVVFQVKHIFESANQQQKASLYEMLLHSILDDFVRLPKKGPIRYLYTTIDDRLCFFVQAAKKGPLRYIYNNRQRQSRHSFYIFIIDCAFLFIDGQIYFVHKCGKRFECICMYNLMSLRLTIFFI